MAASRCNFPVYPPDIGLPGLGFPIPVVTLPTPPQPPGIPDLDVSAELNVPKPDLGIPGIPGLPGFPIPVVTLPSIPEMPAIPPCPLDSV